MKMSQSYTNHFIVHILQNGAKLDKPSAKFRNAALWQLLGHTDQLCSWKNKTKKNQGSGSDIAGPGHEAQEPWWTGQREWALEGHSTTAEGQEAGEEQAWVVRISSLIVHYGRELHKSRWGPAPAAPPWAQTTPSRSTTPCSGWMNWCASPTLPFKGDCGPTGGRKGFWRQDGEKSYGMGWPVWAESSTDAWGAEADRGRWGPWWGLTSPPARSQPQW